LYLATTHSGQITTTNDIGEASPPETKTGLKSTSTAHKSLIGSPDAHEAEDKQERRPIKQPLSDSMMPILDTHVT